MGLRDIFKKKDEGPVDAAPEQRDDASRGTTNAAEFIFVRTDTTSQEVIQPPEKGGLGFGGGGGNGGGGNHKLLSPKPSIRSARQSLDVSDSGRDRSSSVSSHTSHSSKRRLSERLRLGRSPESSDHVPQDLPEITTSMDPGDQSQWEKRATMLVRKPSTTNVASGTALGMVTEQTPMVVDGVSKMSLEDGRRSRSRSPSPNPSPSAVPVSSKAIDEDIQEAIRLHEEGSLASSTKLFGRLADPEGANNPLSQVLYGLALRHGWGCEPDLPQAVKYLTAAASNSAAVEQLALQAGMTKGGAAKGELVMAIYELANCFRHGWGIERDAFAARQYYETAANLGDTDAMNDAAWCFEHGFGGKKDKFTAARYYRLAEAAGNKTMGNSWIWKDKYDPERQAKKR
ncbi:uncharacterized protein CPUR_05201 [Claviceps purpurea 20.1]|uniref:Uncharacterized protein n=1 Tax=Claviceps purpurea (strain 20.1) TaxID=1111077 RepID=M1WFY5_CLAP2|nr:hypothetical protein E4U11_000873 [Claviceps purpurea]KAG6277374.1 hypothetical protein E4U48_001093 [Claviceps purpurea]CCE31349.1 uncharacterized protein CPUR_05201 [Claviceps purpurea 20.1]